MNDADPADRNASQADVRLTRRRWLSQAATVTAGAAAAATLPSGGVQAAPARLGDKPAWRFCFNTSCIRGQQLGLLEQIDVTVKAGYSGIEPWLRDIEAFEQAGGSLRDVRKRLEDAGLTVESVIGFARWAVDDPQERAAGLEQAKRDMERVRAIGGTRIAAPPVGATAQPVALPELAQRYRALLELGRQMGVVPELEVWGHSRSLGLLAESVYVAVAAGHPDACLLPDVYHLYKGGSSFEGLRLLWGGAIPCFHVNDYPAQPPRETITDADRVYPGDGVAPLKQIFGTLREIGFEGALSLELFNRTYWQQDAAQVARTGLLKMQEAVARALEG